MNDIVLVLVEHHSADAPWVGDEKMVTRASLYFATGVHADEVFGLSYIERAGGSYLRIAHDIALSDAEHIANVIGAELSQRGICVEYGMFSDE